MEIAPWLSILRFDYVKVFARFHHNRGNVNLPVGLFYDFCHVVLCHLCPTFFKKLGNFGLLFFHFNRVLVGRNVAKIFVWLEFSLCVRFVPLWVAWSKSHRFAHEFRLLCADAIQIHELRILEEDVFT